MCHIVVWIIAVGDEYSLALISVVYSEFVVAVCRSRQVEAK